MKWSFATDLPVQFALVEIDGVQVQENMSAFERLAERAEHYADLYQWTPLSEIPGVQNARQFFRAIGLDPTRRRPSSEALLNRAIKKKELYTVNNLVDVGNWCSLDFLLPTCIYDSDKIQGDVVIRLGQEGESYLALNNREIDFEGRFVLVDETGPFGSPMTDSQRTAVTVETRQAMLGVWAPSSFDKNALIKHAEQFSKRAVEYCGGSQKRLEFKSSIS